MQRALLILVLTLPAIAAQGPPLVGVEFSSPAQIEGNVTAKDLQAVVLVLQGTGSIDLDFRGNVQATTHTTFSHEFTVNGTAMGGPFPSRASEPVSYGQHLGVQLSPRPDGFASLYLEADRIHLEANGTRTRLLRSDASGCMDEELQPNEQHELVLRADDSKCAGQGVVILRLDGKSESGLPIRLDVTGLRRGEWHNMVIQCSTSPCPEGGTRSQQGGRINEEYAAYVQEYHHLDVRADGGSGHSTGPAAAVLGRGTTLDLQATGWLRLPNAATNGTCSSICQLDGNGTLQATGVFALQDLTLGRREDRLEADLSGQYASIRLNESSLSVLSGPAGIAVAGLALTALIYGLVKLVKLLPLFSRTRDGEELNQARTKAVFDLICSRPGLSQTGMSQILGWSHGNVQYHLNRLTRADRIVAHPYRTTQRYYEKHAAAAKAWLEIAALDNPESRQLHAWLQQNPSATQGQTVEHASQTWGWDRMRTRRALSRLEEARLLHRRREGRTNHYTALAVPANLPVPA